MSNLIQAVSFDPSQSNFGIADVTIDVDTLEIKVVGLKLISTESEASKGVIKVSDNLRRAKEIQEGMQEALKGKVVAIAEIPLMITSANPRIASLANYNSGMMVGVLSAIGIPLIQVFPKDVKMASVGIKDACKEEMIAWALKNYPDAPWIMRKLKGNYVPTAANEHLADAVAAAHAAIRTDQFGMIRAAYQSMPKAA